MGGVKRHLSSSLKICRARWAESHGNPMVPRCGSRPALQVLFPTLTYKNMPGALASKACCAVPVPFRQLGWPSIASIDTLTYLQNHPSRFSTNTNV